MNKFSDQYEVLAIRMGTRDSTKSDVYLNFGLYGVENESISVDYYFWILRNADHTIIVDTGFSQEGGEKRHRQMLIHPREALLQLGIDPSEVTALILTHGHYDHVGNADLFPNAPIFMATSEFDFWTSPMAERHQFAYYSESAEIAFLQQAQADGRLQLFENDLTLFPGVRLARVGGHTPGQTMVYVDSFDGTVLLASDALHFYEELEQDMPFTAICDLPKMYDAFDRIRAERGIKYEHLIAGHDRSVIESFPACASLPKGLGVVISRSPA